MTKRYHIIIEVLERKKAISLFEDIQNRFELYDNCVIEESYETITAN